MSELFRQHHIALIPLLPGVSAFLLGILWIYGKKLPKTAVDWIACGSVGLSFLVSVASVWGLRASAQTVGIYDMFPKDHHTDVLWEWFAFTPDFRIPFAFELDHLSAVMILVVTGIGFLIHVYSTAYMGADLCYQRFMAWLNLFMFSMLVLVLGNNFLMMFIGWEGVGLCSYGLISFWYQELPNAKAGMKAFVVNRVGDFAFVTGLMALVWGVGDHTGFYSMVFREMVEKESTSHVYSLAQSNVHLLGLGLITFSTLCFFGGATGKSAQIPLYVWLPDAMAGPTPVSALIHAATMVTAGVYMVTRLNFLFSLAPMTLEVVAIVGGATAVIAATIGLFQYDIKKVLAYSTVSQLGYMFLGLGAGAYAAGMFHVFTHAFFKACLFLGSGSVIHALHHALPHGMDAQDMRNMGGIKRFMPVTFWTFALSVLAIAGIFPFAGFWSKDEILWKVFQAGSHSGVYYALWVAGLAGALMTAFYMTRQLAMTFFGDYRGRKAGEEFLKAHDREAHHANLEDPHESPYAITIPLMVLAAGAVLAGLLGLGGWTHLPNLWEGWLAPVLEHGEEAAAEAGGHGLELLLAVVSVGIAGVGIYFADRWYRQQPEVPARLLARYGVGGPGEKSLPGRLYRLVYHKYFVDEAYQAVFVVGMQRLSTLSGAFDRWVVDGFFNLLGYITLVVRWAVGAVDRYVVDGVFNHFDVESTRSYGLLSGVTDRLGRFTRRAQSGDLQSYLRFLGYGTVAAVSVYLLLTHHGSF